MKVRPPAPGREMIGYAGDPVFRSSLLIFVAFAAFIVPLNPSHAGCGLGLLDQPVAGVGEDRCSYSVPLPAAALEPRRRPR